VEPGSIGRGSLMSDESRRNVGQHARGLASVGSS
jgi:hypothetical protein